MSVGGSGWGTGEGQLAQVLDGFGGIAREWDSVWSSGSVEDGWSNLGVDRGVVPWFPSEDDLLNGGNGPILGLPDTPVGIESRDLLAKQVSISEQQLAALRAGGRVELGEDVARAVVGAQERAAQDAAVAAYLQSQVTPVVSAGTSVGTQFTGPVTVQGRDSDRLIESLTMELTKG